MTDEPETTAVAVRDAVPSPLALIQSAIAQGLDPDKLTKLFDLQERHEKGQAAQAFADAITAFQTECPPVVKDRTVKNANGSSRYKFANFEDLMAVAGPVLAKHGIAIAFDTMPMDGALMVTCKVRVGIHVEASAVTVPLLGGGSGNNDVQALGSTVSYGKRYALINALNMVVVDEDDDAQTARPAPQRQPSPPPPAKPVAESWTPAAAATRLATLHAAIAKRPAPLNGSDLRERGQWLAKELAKLTNQPLDRVSEDLTTAMTNAVLLGDEWTWESLAANQLQPMWAATVAFVADVASPTKAGAA